MKTKVSSPTSVLVGATLLALASGANPVLHAQADDRVNPSRPGEVYDGTTMPPDQNQVPRSADEIRQSVDRAGYDNRMTEKTAPKGRLLGDLRGREVHNLQGEKLGSINDIIIDTDSGRASYVLVQSGGVLGMGQRLRAVPTGALDQDMSDTREKRRLTLDVSRDRWDQAPLFERKRLADLENEQQGRALHDYYGQTWGEDRNVLFDPTRRPSVTGTANPTTPAMNPSDRGQTRRQTDNARAADRGTTTGEATGAGGMAGTDSAASAADRTIRAPADETATQGLTQDRELALASDIKGKTLRNGDHEVGAIADVVVKLEDREAAVLLDPAPSFADTDGKYVVPFTRVNREGEDRYTTTLTKQDLNRPRAGSDAVRPWVDDKRVRRDEQPAAPIMPL